MTKIHLREYQREAIDAVTAAWGDGIRRPAIVLATGLGKTVIFSQLASEFQERTGQRVLILVHRDELANQAIEKIRGTAPHLSVGKVKAGDNEVSAEVVVASVQTLTRSSRLDQLRNGSPVPVGLVIQDEVHHGAAPSFRKVYDAFGCGTEGGALFLGVTATLARGDGIGLGSVIDDVVYEKSIAWGIRKKFLSPVRGVAVRAPELDLSAVRSSRGDYQASDLGHAMADSGALDVIPKAYAEHAADRPGVVFSPTVATAEYTAEILRDSGISSAVISGATPRDERLKIFEDYRTGRVQVLSNCMVLCLDTETEILTDRGWTTYDQMTHGHRVANWDQGRVFFKEPHEIVVRDRGESEDMYFLETARRSIRVTGRHRMLYRTYRTGQFKKSPVDDLAGRKVSLPTNGMAEPESPSSLTLDECRLTGFWVGDGSKGRPGGGVEYTLSQSTRYGRIIDWVDGVLDRTGIDFRRRDKSDYVVPHIRWSLPRGTGHGPQARKGVVHFEDYLDKSGSGLLWNLDKEQFDAFLEGLWYADGDHLLAEEGFPDQFQIYGATLPLLETIQSVATVRGWTCSLRKDTPPRKENHRQLYRLSFHRRIEHRMGGTDPRYRIQKETSPWRPEKVWCVRTETRNIITRRNGSVTVMGNTEGFDAPHTSCIVIARPTQSNPLYIQMVGRGTRTYPGKTDCLVLDIVGAGAGNKLRTLVDLEPGMFPEKTPCEVCDRVPCACPCAGCGGPRPCQVCHEDTELELERGKTEEVDLFAGSTQSWLVTRGGVLFVPAGESGEVLLWQSQTPGHWDVVHAPKAGKWIRLHEALPMGTASAWAETEADELSGFNVRKTAAWRKKKPSEAQLRFASQLGIALPADVRSGDLGNLISVAMASRKLDRYIPRV